MMSICVCRIVNILVIEIPGIKPVYNGCRNFVGLYRVAICKSLCRISTSGSMAGVVAVVMRQLFSAYNGQISLH